MSTVYYNENILDNGNILLLKILLYEHYDYHMTNVRLLIFLYTITKNVLILLYIN